MAGRLATAALSLTRSRLAMAAPRCAPWRPSAPADGDAAHPVPGARHQAGDALLPGYVGPQGEPRFRATSSAAASLPVAGGEDRGQGQRHERARRAAARGPAAVRRPAPGRSVPPAGLGVAGEAGPEACRGHRRRRARRRPALIVELGEIGDGVLERATIEPGVEAAERPGVRPAGVRAARPRAGGNGRRPGPTQSGSELEETIGDLRSTPRRPPRMPRYRTPTPVARRRDLTMKHRPACSAQLFGTRVRTLPDVRPAVRDVLVRRRRRRSGGGGPPCSRSE